MGTSPEFIVNQADRTKITVKESPSTPWTDDWHTVKVVRRVADGTIEVYFDDMKAPLMTAFDETFGWGAVGVGCFDDAGDWDDVQLNATKVDKPVRLPQPAGTQPARESKQAEP